MVWTRALLVAGAIGILWPSFAEARDRSACQEAWARAVRSYLTQNRRAGPDGEVPANMDEEELAAQAWTQAFAPSCRMEQDGDKAGARVEAAFIGASILAKLDPRGCVKFMDVYMQSDRARDICSGITARGAGDVRQMIASSIPARDK